VFGPILQGFAGFVDRASTWLNRFLDIHFGKANNPANPLQAIGRLPACGQTHIGGQKRRGHASLQRSRQ
jgi:hypothetical protein